MLAGAGFLAFQPLGREVNDNVYAPFFAVLFVLFSFGLHERRGRVAARRRRVHVRRATASSLVDRRLLEHRASTCSSAGWSSPAGRSCSAACIANRSRLNAALREKAERLRRDRAAQAEQAAAEERARIAGELHDVVAHAMSAMVVQAGGARRLASKDPERAREAFAAVEDTGREALTEIRRLLGVLRHQDDEIALAPQPSLRHLAALVAPRPRGGAARARSRSTATRATLPPGVDLTAYRLVQEALEGAIDAGRRRLRRRRRALPPRRRSTSRCSTTARAARARARSPACASA